VKEELRYEGLIAACGMNCGLCIGYLREKKPCGGCFRKDDKNKPELCRSCSIKNCELLAQTESGFCYDCLKFPCSRLKGLDQRYRTKYGMSMLDNLRFIQTKGMLLFLKSEQDRWTCRECGSGLSVHRTYCLNCKTGVKA
jgi:hypothetical protein